VRHGEAAAGDGCVDKEAAAEKVHEMCHGLDHRLLCVGSSMPHAVVHTGG
jgi:hypothetical protein